jgi:DNA-binding transcriptional MerR regulator
MDKSPEAFRTISEVAETLDVPPHVLRFWETRFTQVKPVKRGGGRRYYRPEDVRLLRGIRGLLYDDGMTIKGVQKILRERGIRHVIGLGTPLNEDGPTDAPRIDAPRTDLTLTEPAPGPIAPPRAPIPAPEAAPGALLETTLLAPALHPAREPFPMTDPEPIPAEEADGPELTGPARMAALIALVAELETLRAIMAAD